MLGADSMVGSHFASTTRLSIATAGRRDPRIVGIPTERFDPINLLETDSVRRYVSSTSEPVVINFAARTDVDGVERERPRDAIAEGGPAWIVNAVTPGAIAAATAAGKRYLIHISTDFVFDGTAGPYEEHETRSALSNLMSWYGWTKSEGERRVLENDPKSVILRIAYPYRPDCPLKLDFARRLIAASHAGELPPLYTDQVITPTWVPDVSRTILELLTQRPSGVFHVASPEVTTPFDFGRELLRQIEGREPNLVSGTLGTGRASPALAPRPLHGGLRTGRLRELGVKATSWREGILTLARSGQSS